MGNIFLWLVAGNHKRKGHDYELVGKYAFEADCPFDFATEAKRLAKADGGTV